MDNFQAVVDNSFYQNSKKEKDVSLITELLVSVASVSPGTWWEDNEGFIASEAGIIADARADENEIYADANTEFIILAKNSMPDVLYALGVLKMLVAEDQDGGDAFEKHGPAARSALRKLQVRI